MACARAEDRKFKALFALSSGEAHLVSHPALRLTSWLGGSGPMEQEVRARELKEFLTQAAKLTSTQREQVLAHLGTGFALDRATAIVQSRLAQAPWLSEVPGPARGAQRPVLGPAALQVPRLRCHLQCADRHAAGSAALPRQVG